jgi:hypothetical protein
VDTHGAASLVSMLLDGGVGYEERRPEPAMAIEYGTRSPLRRPAPFVEPLTGWTGGTDTCPSWTCHPPRPRRLCQKTGPQFYRAGSCRGDAGLLPDDAMAIGICIRPCCGAERVSERHCHRPQRSRNSPSGRYGSISYLGWGFWSLLGAEFRGSDDSEMGPLSASGRSSPCWQA